MLLTRVADLEIIVTLKCIEYGSGYIKTRSPYTPCSIYLKGGYNPNIYIYTLL